MPAMVQLRRLLHEVPSMEGRRTAPGTKFSPRFGTYYFIDTETGAHISIHPILAQKRLLSLGIGVPFRDIQFDEFHVTLEGRQTHFFFTAEGDLEERDGQAPWDDPHWPLAIGHAVNQFLGGGQRAIDRLLRELAQKLGVPPRRRPDQDAPALDPPPAQQPQVPIQRPRLTNDMFRRRFAGGSAAPVRPQVAPQAPVPRTEPTMREAAPIENASDDARKEWSNPYDNLLPPRTQTAKRQHLEPPALPPPLGGNTGRPPDKRRKVALGAGEEEEREDNEASRAGELVRNQFAEMQAATSDPSRVAAFIAESTVGHYDLSELQSRALAMRGCEQIAVAPDGNCLFEAFAQTEGIDGGHPVVREHIAEKLAKHKNDRFVNLRDSGLLEPGIEALRKDGDFDFASGVGDAMPEILAMVYKIQLVLIKPNAIVPIGSGREVPLLYFDRRGLHYHGTRPLPVAQPGNPGPKVG